MTTSTSSAVWEGGLRNGHGRFNAGSGAFGGDYSFATRFESAKGTNPEELLAAAHAACFSMALSAGLEAAKTPATRISTTARCTVEKAGDGFQITRMRLEVRGEVPGLDQAAFQAAAEKAKVGCPVSQALKGIPQVELDAKLGG
ncbi:MAG TPA: OsmC family peroxiredoxin [Gemmatimonadales bacterium]|jgi:osmotically inducible protein OsmC|nr:OsmC family peroxiredoxin [Gemmatimonadales bacterium]